MINGLLNYVKKDIVLRNTLILVLINGLFLLVYKLVNPHKDIERFYKENNSYKYYLLQFATSVLLISFMLNSKYIVGVILKNGVSNIMNTDLVKNIKRSY